MVEETVFRRLTHDAVFIVELRPLYFWRLPKGTIVQQLRYQPDSVLTHAPGEHYVCAPDNRARIWRGWLAETVRWSAPLQTDSFKPFTMGRFTKHSTLSPWDTLREDMSNTPAQGGYDKRGEPYWPWRAFDWLCYFGPKRSAELRAVIREFGDKTFKSMEPLKLIHRAIKRTIHKEIPMTAIKSTQEQAQKIIDTKKALDAAKAAKKAKKAKAKAEKAPRARTMGKTVGANILEICAKAKVKPFPQAKALADGAEVSATDLTKLRDLINKASETLREKKKTGLASEFSSQNRLVRRLARAAKKSRK